MVVSDFIMTVAGITGALAVIFGGMYSIYKIARRLDMAIGADSDGKTVSDRLSRVEHQLWENGGTSLADRVNRIEDLSKHTATEVSFIKEILLGSMAQAPATTQRRTRQKKTSGVTAAPVFGLSVANLDEE